MSEHKHSVIDTGIRFIIDPMSRKLKNISDREIVLVKGDHNSERITFELPRYIDSHDMSLCNKVYVHYNNINISTKEASADVYEVTDLSVDPSDNEKVTLSWLVSRNATKFYGSLNYMVQFTCVDENAVVTYSWSSGVCSEISVNDGINNAATVVEEYSDILEQWKESIFGSGGNARIGYVSLFASAWVGENNLYSQVVSIEGVTENSQVDLTPDVQQLAVFYEKDLTFVTENDGGVVTVYAIGQKPQNDYTIQVTITEVV